MSDFDFDLFVIGAGSGGVRAARMASGYGARVAIAEERYLGGTCVNVGCIPKKLFVYASEYPEAFRGAVGYGWQVQPPAFDWSTLRDNKDAEISRLNGIYRNLLSGAGVELIEGRAVIAGPNSVRMGDREYSARYILVAVGGWPYIPDFPGREHVISSNEAFYLNELPRRVAIVGGGYIAVEFAGIFNGLGVDTHLIYRGPLFLKEFDRDITAALADQMRGQGVDLRFESNVASVGKNPDGSLTVRLEDGDDLEVDAVMYATGRRPLTADLGLETTDVELDDNGAIQTDERFCTAEPSIYALGDVTGRVELTPVAIAEGMALAANLFDGGDRTMDYESIATAIFSQPTIGTVGLSEEQARERYPRGRVYRSEFRPLKETLGGGDERILMKLIVDGDSDRVVGCHMLGHEAGEIIQGFGVAVKMGATKADLDNTVAIHPTAAEEFVTMRDPVRSWG